MSREKQIEDIANILWHIPNGYYLNSYNDCERIAECIYDDGDYRKQSEGEWKQTTEPLGAHDFDCVECSACGGSWVLDEDFDYDVVEDFWNFCPNCGAKMKGV